MPDVPLPDVPLPDSPLPIGTAWYWALAWMAELDELVARRRAVEELIDPWEAARWHPAIDPDEPIDELGFDELVGFVLARHRDHARLVDWEALEEMAAQGSLPVAADRRHGASPRSRASLVAELRRSLPGVDRLVPSLLGGLDTDSQRLVGSILVDAVLAEQWVRFDTLTSLLRGPGR